MPTYVVHGTSTPPRARSSRFPVLNSSVSAVSQSKAQSSSSMLGGSQPPNPLNAQSALVGEAIGEALQVNVAAMIKKEVDALRDEFCHTTTNLEARLRIQVDDMKSKLDAQVQDLDLRMAQRMQALEEALSCQKSITDEISDRIIEQVNADPRICRVVENHQSLQEGLSHLLQLLTHTPLDMEQKHQKAQHDVDMLREMILETSSRHDSLALAVNMVHQRRSQDVKDMATLVRLLEKKLTSLEGSILKSNNAELIKSLEETFEARGKQGLAAVEEEEDEIQERGLDEETDIQSE